MKCPFIQSYKVFHSFNHLPAYITISSNVFYRNITNIHFFYLYINTVNTVRKPSGFGGHITEFDPIILRTTSKLVLFSSNPEKSKYVASAAARWKCGLIDHAMIS